MAADLRAATDLDIVLNGRSEIDRYLIRSPPNCQPDWSDAHTISPQHLADLLYTK